MKIAVVIPALEESKQIAGAVQNAQAASDSSRSPGPSGVGWTEIEVVVVDGGSLDETVSLARKAGARVISSDSGRSRQLEAGWRAVSADIVLFLHADTRLEAGWSSAIAGAMKEPGVVGGAFQLCFGDPGFGFRWIEFFVRIRVALFGLPYGDQAIFIRRPVLEAMGGLRPVPIMEDLDLVQGMKKYGRMQSLPLKATTSARRYADQGLLRTVLLHGLALLAWRFGVDRERIARWSRR
ncbi:MAG: glycosyltransferase [Deltaproteobacteria bacterium]|nr:glycosyltransferase [Deltaproteobacteria bacterium]